MEEGQKERMKSNTDNSTECQKDKIETQTRFITSQSEVNVKTHRSMLWVNKTNDSVNRDLFSLYRTKTYILFG